MNKITIQKEVFELNGEIVKEGRKLDFSAINRAGQKVDFKDLKGSVVISVFPDINTGICDAQTQAIAKLAQKHTNIQFISLTTDDVETINSWCVAKHIENVDIWSDKEQKEFGEVTSTLIKKINKLARGFIITKDQIITGISFKEEIAEDPDYAWLDKQLETL